MALKVHTVTIISTPLTSYQHPVSDWHLIENLSMCESLGHNISIDHAEKLFTGYTGVKLDIF